MGKIEFVTRVRINGVYYTEADVPKEEMKKMIQEKVDDILLSMNYERKAAS